METQGKSLRDKALEIAALLRDSKGEDVCAIDVSGLNSWTDYFVIATTTSAAQSHGMYKAVKDYVRDNDLEIHVPNRKIPDGDEWTLVDLGPIVVHLMSAQARSFYELEKLWHKGKTLD